MTLCLIVDDDKMACKIAADVAIGLGLETVMENNGLAAITFCNKRMPDIIVLDVMMPKMDGIAFLKELRKMMGGRNVFVIACTAKTDSKTVSELKNASVNAFIVKPFEPEKLEEKIKSSGAI